MQRALVYFADFIIILFCIIGFYHVYEKAGLPVLFYNNSLIIEPADKNFPNSNLKTNDKLIAVEKIKITSQEDLEFILDSKPVGYTTNLLAERNGSVISVKEQLIRFYSYRYFIIQASVSVVFIFLGLFVFIKKQNDFSAQIFNWVILFATLIVATTWGRFTINPYGLGLVIRIVFNLAYAFAATLFIHFTFVFPYKKSGNTGKIMIALYSIAGVFTVTMDYGFLNAARTINLDWFHFYNTVFNLNRVYFAACILFGLINIHHTYFTASEESDRRKLRWILMGVTFGPICLISLWIVPQILTSRGLVDEEYILLAVLSVPITFSISIIKYHILDIDQIFKRGTVYTIILFFVLLIYAGIVSSITLMIGQLTVTSSLSASALSAVIIAAVFQPIRSWSQNFVDKKFFNVRYNFRNVEKDFTENIKYCYDNNSLRRVVLDTIDKNIPADKTELIFLTIDKNGRENFLSSLKLTLMNITIPLANKEHIELGAKFRYDENALLNKYGFVIAFPVYSESGGLIGALLLGEKKSGFRYNLEDIDLLESFCHQIAFTLGRINLQRKLISEQTESQRLKELNELKSYFVSSVTHELKTPLTSISMFAELLEKNSGINKKNRNEYTGIIKGESYRLARLIDNVLNISKIEKGIKEYHYAEVDLNEIVEQAVKTMIYQLKINRFEYSVSLCRSKLLMNADQDALIEAFINLISNAIKYSGEKKVIKIKTFTKKNFAYVSIKDYGIGISRNNIEKIFKPFERIGTSGTKIISGTGLGLAIVKHIMDAHKGKIKVKSELKKGSEFVLSFPLI